MSDDVTHDLMADIDRTVTLLLNFTKDLLNSLSGWSEGHTSIAEVNHIYQLLAEQFASATLAFEAADMGMNDLAQFPDLLQKYLQACLADEPSTEALEKHLPDIRDTILLLLQGLKSKQARVLHVQRPPTRKGDEPSLRMPTPTLPDEGSKPSHSPTMMNSDAYIALKQNDSLAQRSTVRRHQDNPRQSLSLFLKLGNHVKKTTFQNELSLASLRAFFEASFSTTLSESAEIQILDNETNIMYTLEDMADVQAHCLLFVPAGQESTVTLGLNEKLGEMQKTLSEIKLLLPADRVCGTLPWTGGQSADTLVQGIKDQQQQLVQLRRDIAAVARVYRLLCKDTSETLVQLRAQASGVTSEMTFSSKSRVMDRAVKDSAKDRTERMAGLITSQLQELQRTIDDLKLDVTQRRRWPSEAQLTHCDEKVGALEKAMGTLSLQIEEVKPGWKKAWEEELQRIVEEQRFLKDHETLLLDLREDYEAALEVLDHLKKVRAIQGHQRPGPPTAFRIPPAEDGFEGMTSVLRQLTTIDVDHQRRVKALEEVEEMRARELANRIDAFEEELVTFVCSNKLKKTGGPQQVERQRQRQNEILLKTLFTPADHDVPTAASPAP